MPLRQALRRALQRRLRLLTARLRAQHPDAAIWPETISDTRGELRLWRIRSNDHDNDREDDAP